MSFKEYLLIKGYWSLRVFGGCRRLGSTHGFESSFDGVWKVCGGAPQEGLQARGSTRYLRDTP